MSAIERELIDRIAEAKRFKPPMPPALMNAEQKAQLKIDRARHREEQARNAPTIDAGLFGNYQKVEAPPHLKHAPAWGRSLLAAYLRYAGPDAGAWVQNATADVQGNYIATPTELTEKDSEELEDLKSAGFQITTTIIGGNVTVTINEG